MAKSFEAVPAKAEGDEDSAFWDWIKAEKEAGRDHHVFAAKAGFDAGRAITEKGEHQ